MTLLRSSLAFCKLADALTILKKKVKNNSPKNGLSGRLSKGSAPGVGVSSVQGPKALAPRISKPST